MALFFKYMKKTLIISKFYHYPLAYIIQNQNLYIKESLCLIYEKINNMITFNIKVNINLIIIIKLKIK